MTFSRQTKRKKCFEAGQICALREQKQVSYIKKIIKKQIEAQWKIFEQKINRKIFVNKWNKKAL